MGDMSEGSMTQSRKCHRLAAASLVLGAAAVGCTIVVVMRAFLGPHLLPTERDYLWRMPAMVAWLWPTLGAAVAGIVVSVVARRRSDAGLRGARLARGGLALSIGASALALLSVLALPVWTGATESARRAQCISHIHDLGLALEMYVSDWGRYPEAARWCDVLVGYVPDRATFRCPDAPGECGYAYNTALDRRPLGIADSTRWLPAIFESDRGWNAHGGRELLPPFPRHSGGDSIAFAGGTGAMGLTEWWPRQRPEGEVRWDTTWSRRYEQSVGWHATAREGGR
jgi:type II secretory pathway pseudopilin PulG